VRTTDRHAIAFRNLALKTFNTDGSTTVYGEQGNAIVDIGSDGVSVFALPSVSARETTVPIWYAPAITDQYFPGILAKRLKVSPSLRMSWYRSRLWSRSWAEPSATSPGTSPGIIAANQPGSTRSIRWR
jgi:hypothetical protein